MDLPQPHVLVVPFPAQGHVTPLMKLAHKLAANGVKVTFANTEFVEERILASMSDSDKEQCPITLVSFPDGLEPEDDRKGGFKLIDSMKKVVPGHLMALIKQINGSDNDEPITFVIADATFGMTLEVAGEMGIKQVAVFPAGPGALALLLHIPKLIETGVIDSNGASMKNELIQLFEKSPAWNSTEFTWSYPGNPEVQKLFFDTCLTVKQTVEHASNILCNTYYELDSSACAMIPNLLPIGPLLSNNISSLPGGSFSFQDSTCLTWLDKQQPSSVIYVAFGSTGIFNQNQFNELALALELTGCSFLWVVRSDNTNEYPNGFLERVLNRSKIVEWAPQEKVLAHPSVSCFLSHCGWNSTMEGLSSGVPFLCWPYFGDQFYNQNFICEIWKVGLKLNRDDNGIVWRNEIKEKINNLLSNDGMKASAVKLKENAMKSVSKGGSSFQNFERFVEYLKD